jgi:alcohol dehydrogenase class IV
LGTVIYFGKDCLKINSGELVNIGNRALIATGKSSAKLSGALDDVVEILRKNNITYKIFDGVENNPSVENVTEGAEIARSFGAEFIIGIGGGSPLDAAKAIAVLCTNDIDPSELFTNSFRNKMLPVICIPTTAGTGSEVTPYSILTKKDISSKKSFGNDETFPCKSFLDPRYTESMSFDLIVSTAADTLSHAIEGYLTSRSTPVSDVLALEVLKIFGESVGFLTENKIDYELRERLLYIAMLGGIVISQSGTTIVHGMGYSLTYFKGVPHGQANGVLLKEFLRFNYDSAKKKIDNILKVMGIKSIDDFGKMIDSLFKRKISVKEDEIKTFSEIMMKHPSISTNARKVEFDDVAKLFRESLRG